MHTHKYTDSKKNRIKTVLKHLKIGSPGHFLDAKHKEVLIHTTLDKKDAKITDPMIPLV